MALKPLSNHKTNNAALQPTKYSGISWLQLDTSCYQKCHINNTAPITEVEPVTKAMWKRCLCLRDYQMDTNGEVIPVHTAKVYGREEIQHHGIGWNTSPCYCLLINISMAIQEICHEPRPPSTWQDHIK
jgi:hypothetical protein